MGSMQSFYNGFFSFLFLFIHLGCFAIFSNPNPNIEQHEQQQNQSKKTKITPISTPSSSTNNPNHKPFKSLSRSVLSYLNNLMSFKRQPLNPDQPPQESQPTSSLLTSTPDASPKLITPSKIQSFACRNDIYPCMTCGEVLSKPQHLDFHRLTKHSLSELRDSDSGKNIVQIIFRTGWKADKSPTIHKILKIHNTQKTLTRFEEYRNIVRLNAARNGGGVDHERCLADGNERLRFYCSTMLCAAMKGSSSNVGACGSQYCSTCGIIRYGFVGKHVELDGIGTYETSWGAHVSLPEELEKEFEYLHVRRAMLVCRVVAGRVARDEKEVKKGDVFDSAVPKNKNGNSGEEEGELLVFNPRAVLPCFVIIYSTL